MSSFEIPPFPVLSTPFMLQYSALLFEKVQKKYNMRVRIVPIPYPSPSTPVLIPAPPSSSSPTSPKSPSLSPSTTANSYSTPSSPERKAKMDGSVGSEDTDTRVNGQLQACQCNVCGKKFSRQWLLQGHLRTHTGEKPFKCEICSKHFADKSNLRAHVQTHSGTKPHKCSRCGKRFALKSYLSKHEESKCLARFPWTLV